MALEVTSPLSPGVGVILGEQSSTSAWAWDMLPPVVGLGNGRRLLHAPCLGSVSPPSVGKETCLKSINPFFFLIIIPYKVLLPQVHCMSVYLLYIYLWFLKNLFFFN